MQLDQGIIRAIGTHFPNFINALNEFQNHVATIESSVDAYKIQIKNLLERSAPEESPLQEKVNCLLAENNLLRIENAELHGKKHGLKKALKLSVKLFKESRTKRKIKKHWHWNLPVKLKTSSDPFPDKQSTQPE